MKKIFVFTSTILSLLLLSQGCNKKEEGPIGIIYGQVTDKNNEPINGASINLSPSDITTTTEMNGWYYISDVSSGKYELSFSKSGNTIKNNIKINGNCLRCDAHMTDFEYIHTFEYNGHTYWVAPDPHTSASEYISWSAANTYCENLTLYGYSDWRLPTIEELGTMYQHRNIIGGFFQGKYYAAYWSSSIQNNYHQYINWATGETSTNQTVETRG